MVTCESRLYKNILTINLIIENISCVIFFFRFHDQDSLENVLDFL